MPNRIIKESICRSDTIDSLSWFEEVLFYRLIVVCDDYGRFDGRAAIIKGFCFPLKDVTVKQIENSLNKLVSVGLVRVYEAQGRPYLQMSTWEKHQQIRAKKSKFPTPDEICNQFSEFGGNCKQNIESDRTCNQMISNDCNSPRNPIQIQSKSKYNPNPICPDTALTRFEDFWSAFPRKERRKLTENAYCDLILSGIVTEEELVTSARNYAKHIEETGDKMYLPNNFLEKHVFEDFLSGTNQEQEAKSVDVGAEQEEELVGDDWIDVETPWGR